MGLSFATVPFKGGLRVAFSEMSDLIKSGERSRLIPVVADSSKEERAVSSLLAAFSVVSSLAQSMLQDVGGPTNQRATIRCYSQVVFKNTAPDTKLRPDGFIEVDSGRKVWRAVVEAKIGNAELTAEQIEAYLDLARELGIDALITISNQFSTLPTHHPVTVNRQKLRSVELYHFSWLAILTKAKLLSEDKSINDPEQAFILAELIRYLSHESCGVYEMTRLGKEWKEVAAKVQTGTPLSKTDLDATAVVSQWHQLTRYLALELSVAIGKSVDVWLPRAHVRDPAQRLIEECAEFAASHALSVELEIPNAVSRLRVEADFVRRSLRFSVDVNTPADRARPTAAVNWLTRQLSALPESPDTLLRVHWTGRSPDTVGSLAAVIADPKTVIPEDKKELPTGFQVQRVVDLAARFKGANTFVEDACLELPRFYRDVVQNLSNWIPKAPVYKERATEPSADAPNRGPLSTPPASPPVSSGLEAENASETESPPST
jgi:hypothetical protein